MDTVRQWLLTLDLGQYATNFESNDIDLALLTHVDDQTLKDIGITSAGHRLRLRAAIRQLSDHAAKPDPLPDRKPQVAPATAPSAERRQVTVMFCDLVGSTALSARMDPEDLRDIIATYQKTVADTVRRFGGFVAQYLGDGVLAYFGYPRAYEDNAERATRAALEVVAAVGALHSAVPLQSRIGIATGLVVVGDLLGETQEPGIVGETPNLAARLQAIAGPDMVVLGDGTRRLLGSLFAFEDLGEHVLKGFTAPVRAWAALAAGSSESRFDAMHGGPLTALVGRDEELALLQRRWRQARAGEGQVVLLSGEPGIGKSRIMDEVRHLIGAEPHTRLRYQCAPFHTQSPLHPMIEQFERAAGFTRSDTTAEKYARTEALLRGSLPAGRVVEVLPLLAALLSLPPDQGVPQPAYVPQKQKELTLQALSELVLALSARQPVLVQFEDVHWIDPTTQDVLDLLIGQIPHAPVLMIVTCRPEYVSRWSGAAHVSTIVLNRLNRRIGADLVHHAFGGHAIPPDLLEQILAQTDGVPLFVEELARTVLESGLLRPGGNGYELTGPLSPLAIPPTLQDSLMARLDRLADVREIAQIGACIGREFPHDLLAHAAQTPEPALAAALRQLADADLIFRQGSGTDTVYSFKHALVRDAAYASLLKSRRAILHHAIAEALETQFPARSAAAPEVVAHHYTEAGLHTQAVTWWLQAGQHAISRFANVEAAEHLQAGLRALQGLPDGVARDRLELALQAALGVAIGSWKGYTPPEVGRAFERARDLCNRVGDAPNKFQILWGVGIYYHMRADYETCLALGRDGLALAPQAAEPCAAVMANTIIGACLMFQGKLDAMAPHIDAAVTAYQDAGAPALGAVYGYDPGIIAVEWRAWLQLLSGWPDQAARSYTLASTYATAQAHPLSLATTMTHHAIFLAMAGDVTATRIRASEAAAFSRTNNILIREAEAQILEGWARAEQGDTEAGIAETEAALGIWGSLGARIFDSFWYLLLARAYKAGKRFVDARRTLDTARQAADDHGEGLIRAELLRFEGDLHLAGHDHSAAERCYRDAVACAGLQGARLLELRAATSLAHLLHERGEDAAALAVLAPVQAWFTEGF
ncbi:MAG: AAA family ATPase, partial [Proteobacteria bacterium]|nr:AAA family ATPase [Pseudomonadota bacterium]